jgi:hypothetical protein
MLGLPGLRIAQFITSIHYLNYTFGLSGKPTILLHELREIKALIQLPSLIQVAELFLDFRNVQIWKRSQGRAQMRTSIFELKEWTETLGSILSAVGSKSCRKLTVHEGGLFSAHYQDQDILELPVASGSGLNTTTRMSKPFTSVHNLFRTTKPSLSSDLVNPIAAHHEGLWKKHLTNKAQPAALVLNSYTTFNLESSLLLHQPFLDWTIATLSASSIVHLGISLADLRSAAWPLFLSSLKLPSLRVLSIRQSYGLMFADFVSFISRHPTIQSISLVDGTLTLSALDSLSITLSISHPPSAKDALYLPNLTSLRAPPEYTAHILSRAHYSSNKAKDALPKLSHICLPLSCNTIPALDRTMASLGGAHHALEKNIHLTLQNCGPSFIKWIEAKTSYPGSLRVVTSLKLDTGSVPLPKEAANNLPGWLAMFPGLLHLTLDLERGTLTDEERTSFIFGLKKSCPELVSINSLTTMAWLTDGDESSKSTVGHIA